LRGAVLKGKMSNVNEVKQGKKRRKRGGDPPAATNCSQNATVQMRRKTVLTGHSRAGEKHKADIKKQVILEGQLCVNFPNGVSKADGRIALSAGYFLVVWFQCGDNQQIRFCDQWEHVKSAARGEKNGVKTW